jgi:Leucine-rich repeat (LRR) protein
MLMNKNLDQWPAVARLGGVTIVRMKNALLVMGFVLAIANGLVAQTPQSTEHPLLTTNQLDKLNWYYDLDSALANPDNVYKLSLIDQKIKVLPAEFGNFKNLQMLNLSNTRLKRIPLEIKECKNLQVVSLYGNKLKFLPVEMRELKQLEVLYLGKNKLFELPQWIGTLTKLRRLDISQNRLTPADVANAHRMCPKCDVTN